MPTPIQVSMNIQKNSGTFANLTFTVPEGKRLIIHSASVRVTVPTGQMVRATLSGNSTAGAGSQYFVMGKQGTFGGNDVFTGNHFMLLFATPPGGGNFNAVRSSGSGGFFFEASYSGFHEDAA